MAVTVPLLDCALCRMQEYGHNVGGSVVEHTSWVTFSGVSQISPKMSTDSPIDSAVEAIGCPLCKMLGISRMEAVVKALAAVGNVDHSEPSDPLLAGFCASRFGIALATGAE